MTIISKIKSSSAACTLTLTAVLFINIGLLSAEAKKPTIGIVAPLSGYIASIGSAIHNGIDQARNDNPDLFAAANLDFEDDQHDPKLAMTAYRHLGTGLKPNAIMAFGFFFPTILGRDLIRDQIPLINCYYSPGIIGMSEDRFAAQHVSQSCESV
jgi:hypothetical protein